MATNKTTRARRLGRALSVGLALTAGIAMQATPAHADGTESFHYSFRGTTAEARFFSFDGCISTRTWVQGTDGRVKYEPGRPDTSSFILVGISRYDGCNQQHLTRSFGFAELSDDALQIRHDEATLDTTLTMYEYVSGSWMSVDVHLEWVANGSTIRTREHEVIEFPGVRVNLHQSGTMRLADVSGLVSDGTDDYAGGSRFGSINSVSVGEAVVVR